MSSPSLGQPSVSPFTVTTGPCGPARAEVDARCAEAERLGRAAEQQQQQLRTARRTQSDLSRQRDGDALVRDRRLIGEQKSGAQREYHAALAAATDEVTVQIAAATWLRAIDRLNRDVRVANQRAGQLARRLAEAESRMPAMEVAADAARIAAEAAQVACAEARRTLAACEEEAQRAGPPRATPVVAVPVSALLRGDRQALLGLSLRLAEETGHEAGRLQLLLVELGEAIFARALEAYALSFPAGHPFWSQFPAEAGLRVAGALAQMGYRFDGRGGWADGRVPGIRELALALSHSGYDPRSLRRPAGQAAIDGLWAGTVVRAEEHLAARAPDLSLPAMMAYLGPRAAHLAELWDIWGRLRPLLVQSA